MQQMWLPVCLSVPAVHGDDAYDFKVEEQQMRGGVREAEGAKGSSE